MHYVGIALASLPPWILNMGYSTKLITVGASDLTPISFVVMNALFVWLIGRRHMFDLLPIAQGMLLDSIPDPVVVLDGAQTIVAANPAAHHLTGARDLHGMPLAAVPELREVLGALDERGARAGEGPMKWQSARRCAISMWARCR